MIILDLIVFFGAWFFQAFTGFGAGIFIVGILSLIHDPRSVVVSSALVNLLGTVTLALFLMRRVRPRWSVLLPLIIGSVPGILLGTEVLLILDREALRFIIGVFVLFLGVYDLFVQKGGLSRLSMRENPLWSLSAGFLGGFFAGLVGMGGPPPVVYLNQVVKGVDEFKATLTLFFTSNIVFRTVFYWLEGGADFFEPVFLLTALPSVPAGVLFGLYMSGKVRPERIKALVSLSVILLGAALVIQAGLW